jgi:hypothetical protein
MIKINLLLDKKEGLLLITKEIILMLKILQGAMGIITFKELTGIKIQEIVKEQVSLEITFNQTNHKWDQMKFLKAF